MAACAYCKLEMTQAEGCVSTPIVIAGVGYEPVRYGQERPRWRPRQRCGDCGTLPGGVHHHGCDLEQCPRCFGQSITCDCLWAGEEHLSEYWVEDMELLFERSGGWVDRRNGR